MTRVVRRNLPLTACLSASLAIAISASGCATSVRNAARVPTAAYAAREPGCAFEVLGSDKLPYDQVQYEAVGSATVSYAPRLSSAELKAHISKDLGEFVCKWGGTAVAIVYDHSNVEKSSGITVRAGTLVWVLREMRGSESSRYAKLLGVSIENLLTQVSLEHSCPVTQIEVTSRSETLSGGNYRVKACGRELAYRRAGTTYQAVTVGQGG